MSTTAQTITATHEQGATRRLAHLVARKAALGVALTLAVQNVVTVPHFLAFAAPVVSFLHLQMGA